MFNDLAQYGIGFLSLGILAYVVALLLKNRNGKRQSEDNCRFAFDSFAVVIENNTRALEQVVHAVQAVQLTLTRQEVKLDELLERVRR